MSSHRALPCSSCHGVSSQPGAACSGPRPVCWGLLKSSPKSFLGGWQQENTGLVQCRGSFKVSVPGFVPAVAAPCPHGLVAEVRAHRNVPYSLVWLDAGSLPWAGCGPEVALRDGGAGEDAGGRFPSQGGGFPIQGGFSNPFLVPKNVCRARSGAGALLILASFLLGLNFEDDLGQPSWAPPASPSQRGQSPPRALVPRPRTPNPRGPASAAGERLPPARVCMCATSMCARFQGNCSLYMCVALTPCLLSFG